MSRYHRLLRRFWIGLAILARSRLAAAAVALVPLVLIWFFLTSSGCRDTSTTGEHELRASVSEDQWREEYFQYAASNLQRLEEFGGDKILQEVVDRLNQWIRTQELPADWSPDPLVATLPQPLAQLPEVRALDKLEFLRSDGESLQEAIWLRDLSGWARGKQLGDLERAEHLFDWVVRNIQLEPDATAEGTPIPNLPWEALLFGRGTATDRAWVFVRLARQHRIDAVVLALPSEDDDAANGGPKLWAVGVLNDAKLYLFDPALGLPIPGPDGVTRKEDGSLDIRPATLDQVVENDALLRQLDLDAEHPYPVRAEQLDGVVAMVEGAPAALSARMQLVESHLAGQQKVMLTTRPSVVVERVKTVPGLADVRLWTWPYEVLRQRGKLAAEVVAQRNEALAPFLAGRNSRLWRARVLHLKGEFTGPECATFYYQEARMADRRLAEIRIAAEDVDNPKEAERLRRAFEAGKQAERDASYWMGLIENELGNNEAALDYYVRRTLEVSPDGPWTTGALYNTGRTFESLGRPDEAADVYRSDRDAPDYHGRALRAKWLAPKS